MALSNYDSREKVYRNWEFASPGNFPETEIAGTWDEAAQTLTWKAVGKDQATYTKTIRFIDKDTYEQTIVNEDPDGKILLDAKSNATRRK